MIDAHGVEALSMRKLGQALHRDPMRVYRHTKNKAALLDAVAELVLQGLVVPATVDGDWETAIRTAAHSFRDTALAHPQMVSLFLNRPLAVPHGALRPAGLQWLEAVLGLLADAGFDDDGALHAYRFFTAFLAGHVIWEVQEFVDDPPERNVDNRLGLDLLPAGQFPRIRSLARGLVTYNGSIEFALGLDIVVLGLRHSLHAIPTRLTK